MKLVIAIIQDEDSPGVMGFLNKAGFGATKLATRGSFLHSGNTTLIVGVEDNKKDEVIKIIGENSMSRTQMTTIPSSCGAMHGFIVPPVEVKVGGATVFVVDVEEFRKF